MWNVGLLGRNRLLPASLTEDIHTSGGHAGEGDEGPLFRGAGVRPARFIVLSMRGVYLCKRQTEREREGEKNKSTP